MQRDKAYEELDAELEDIVWTLVAGRWQGASQGGLDPFLCGAQRADNGLRPFSG